MASNLQKLLFYEQYEQNPDKDSRFKEFNKKFEEKLKKRKPAKK